MKTVTENYDVVVVGQDTQAVRQRLRLHVWDFLLLCLQSV